MKKILVVLISIAAGMLLVSSAMAFTPNDSTPGAGINQTVHDLGTAHHGMNYVADPADSLERICIFCHAPHNTYRLSTATGGAGPQADAAYDYLPLWNHELDTAPSFTMYENGPGAPQTGPKASQAIAQGMVPGSTSLLCLSCHDGSIAVNSWGNADQRSGSMSTGTTTIVSAYQIGADGYLGNHHPIGFDYVTAQGTDTELRDASTQITPDSTIADHLYGADTRMECATCHSVHNKGNDGEALLWRSDQNSELCLTCHDKGTYT
ncbi:MAG: cytochrome c3 family protein, partial [Nitrospirota bacterium]